MSKGRYNAILRRIIAGDKALREATDQHRDAWYPEYLSLFEELRDVYNAIGEPLADPWAGYK